MGLSAYAESISSGAKSRRREDHGTLKSRIKRLRAAVDIVAKEVYGYRREVGIPVVSELGV